MLMTMRAQAARSDVRAARVNCSWWREGTGDQVGSVRPSPRQLRRARRTAAGRRHSTYPLDVGVTRRVCSGREASANSVWLADAAIESALVVTGAPRTRD